MGTWRCNDLMCKRPCIAPPSQVRGDVRQPNSAPCSVHAAMGLDTQLRMRDDCKRVLARCAPCRLVIHCSLNLRCIHGLFRRRLVDLGRPVGGGGRVLGRHVDLHSDEEAHCAVNVGHGGDGKHVPEGLTILAVVEQPHSALALVLDCFADLVHAAWVRLVALQLHRSAFMALQEPVVPRLLAPRCPCRSHAHCKQINITTVLQRA